MKAEELLRKVTRGELMVSEWFGASWHTIAYVAGGTAAMYASTVVAVRVAGRRTLAQLSAFDVVVTIAIGSLLASTAVSRDASYAQGLTALVTLLVLQVVVAAARRRFGLLARVLDFEPRVIVENGKVHLDESPLGAQLTRGELKTALRQHGIFDDVGFRVVILEPTGQFSVQRDEKAGPAISDRGGK